MANSCIGTKLDVQRQNFAARLSYAAHYPAVATPSTSFFFHFFGAFRKYGDGGRRPRELALRPAKYKPAFFAQTADDEQRQAERRAWFPGWAGAQVREPVASDPAAGGGGVAPRACRRFRARRSLAPPTPRPTSAAASPAPMPHLCPAPFASPPRIIFPRSARCGRRKRPRRTAPRLS
jgi:hypothetical protein